MPPPKITTPREPAYRKLVRGAIHAAMTGPTRRDRYSIKASVSHEALATIREALDELGIEWRRPAKKEKVTP